MTEGFRRIGIVLGVLGLIGWSFASFMILSEVRAKVTERESDAITLRIFSNFYRPCVV